MPRVINATDIERAATVGRGEITIEPGSVVPTFARQRAEQLGVRIVYGTNGAAAPTPPLAPAGPRNGAANGPFRISPPGGRETAILPQPVPMVQPSNAPTTVFRTPDNAPRYDAPARQQAAAPSPAKAPPPTPTPSSGQRVEYPPAAQTQGKYEIDIKPQYFETPGMDNAYTMAMELGAALWVVKDRVKVLEEILERRGVIADEEIELHTRSSDQRQQAIARRNEYINRIYGILRDNPR